MSEYTPSEYTPTTAQVRDCYIGTWYEQNTRQSREEFYRWLAAEKAKWQAEVLRAVADEVEVKRNEPGLVHLDVRYAGYYTGIRSGMESTARLLRDYADRIEKGSDDE